MAYDQQYWNVSCINRLIVCWEIPDEWKLSSEILCTMNSYFMHGELSSVWVSDFCYKVKTSGCAGLVLELGNF